MPRVTQITVPPERTEQLIEEICQLDGLIGLQRQRSVSVHPPGDVITVTSTNRSLQALMRLLDNHGISHELNGSITTSEPVGITSSSQASAIVTDVSEATWEEMEHVIGKNSNMTVNALLVMAIAGVLAAAGIATNAIHIVIGAMVIVPGFQPLARIGLGAVTKSRAWQRGLLDTAKGYAALVAGAALTALVLRLFGKAPLGGEASYLPTEVLLSYWTTISVTTAIVAAVAGAAGAVLIATDRAVLTAGVMIALGLVPTAAITGMALVSGQMALAGTSALRWAIEAGLVVLFSLLVFGWKQSSVHRRRMSL